MLSFDMNLEFRGWPDSPCNNFLQYDKCIPTNLVKFQNWGSSAKSADFGGPLLTYQLIQGARFSYPK